VLCGCFPGRLHLAGQGQRRSGFRSDFDEGGSEVRRAEGGSWGSR